MVSWTGHKTSEVWQTSEVFGFSRYQGESAGLSQRCQPLLQLRLLGLQISQFVPLPLDDVRRGPLCKLPRQQCLASGDAVLDLGQLL